MGNERKKTRPKPSRKPKGPFPNKQGPKKPKPQKQPPKKN